MKWFDAHLDLAYLAVRGRHMHYPLERAGGPDLPAAVTLFSLGVGGVAACLGTIFTEMGADHAAGYAEGDAEGARRAAIKQLHTYSEWWELRATASLHLPDRSQPGRQGFLKIGKLMEGADPVASPDDLAEWAFRGVVAIGLAWAKGSRYAGGNANTHGLTDLGRAIIPEIDGIGMVHDLSHLSDRACAELLDLAEGRVIASHSNCRVLIDGKNPPPGHIPSQRHLTDDTIRAIVAHKGVIGLNLYSPFLIPGGAHDRRATIAQAIDHVEHICTLAGHRGAVGLGSDMDGGFSAERLPEGINHPRDLIKLAEELRRRGWNDADIHAFAWGNWDRFWVFPERQPRPYNWGRDAPR